MNIQCPNCQSICETDIEPTVGRRMKCPFCEQKFVYESWMSQIEFDTMDAPVSPSDANANAQDEKTGAPHGTTLISWTAYSSAARESAAQAEESSARGVVAEICTRLVESVRQNSAFWALGLVFAVLACCGVLLFSRPGETEEPTMPEPSEETEDADIPADDLNPFGALDVHLAGCGSGRRFNDAKKRFYGDCRIVEDIDRLLLESECSHCIFGQYNKNKLIYEVTATKDGISGVVAIGEGASADVPVDEFMQRLREEPCLVATHNGEIRLNPKGRYDVPVSGRPFSIKNANTQSFWGLGVNFAALNTGRKYGVFVCRRSPGGAGRELLEGQLDYAASVAWDRIAEYIATRHNVRSDAPLVDKERRNYCIVVADASATRKTTSKSKSANKPRTGKNKREKPKAKR